MAVAVAVDRPLAIAGRDELRGAHRARVGAEHGRRIDFLFARQQQELAEFAEKKFAARRIVEAERHQRIDHAITTGDAAEGCFHAENADHHVRELRIFDLLEFLAVRQPEIRALVDALFGQETIAIFVPGRDALGGPADGIENGLLGIGALQQRFQLGFLEAMLPRHGIDEGADFRSLDVEGLRRRRTQERQQRRNRFQP
jgi:hypothetical protein